jgi:hypothetical protein
MPFKSKDQEAYFAEHPEKLGGWSHFLEWAHVTPKNIPKKVTKKDNGR